MYINICTDFNILHINFIDFKSIKIFEGINAVIFYVYMCIISRIPMYPYCAFQRNEFWQNLFRPLCVSRWSQLGDISCIIHLYSYGDIGGACSWFLEMHVLLHFSLNCAVCIEIFFVCYWKMKLDPNLAIPSTNSPMIIADHFIVYYL